MFVGGRFSLLLSQSCGVSNLIEPEALGDVAHVWPNHISESCPRHKYIERMESGHADMQMRCTSPQTRTTIGLMPSRVSIRQHQPKETFDGTSPRIFLLS